MKRTFAIAALALLWTSAANAIPAKPGLTTVAQSDDSTLQIQQLGDEFLHSMATADRFTIGQGADGDYYYVTGSGLSHVRAHDAAMRTADELTFLSDNQCTMAALQQSMQRRGMLRARQASGPRRIGLTQVPTMGSPRVPILLVQYTDKKMSNNMAAFERQYKTGSKSVLQYFTDQSNGLYTPQFDIYGIYQLANNRATYGANSNGLDKGVAQMVSEAIELAGDEIDWSRYDNDGDGEADVCIVVYAGVGEAQSSVRNSVWPCQWTLTDACAYNDGNGAVMRNNTTIDKFAVFNEIAGSSDYGSTMDGIGTFCHEFSHCLGLPDFYETTYRNGYFGMGLWSLMDSGCYNGGTIDGDTPIGYSAYEKQTMGWIEPITPAPHTHYTLPVFNSKSLDNDQALKITALNENEYWMLENRRKQGWDLYIPDEGVMITHFTYIPGRWDENSVNDKAIQLATIIPADNALNSYTTGSDLYGESNHSFTTVSVPAMKANMLSNGTLAGSTGGAGTVDKPVTDITLNADGTASLWYMKGAFEKLTPQLTDTTGITATDFTAHWNAVPHAACYTLHVTDINAPIPEAQLLLTETFPTSKFDKEGAMDLGSTLDNYMDNPGWTGSGLFKQAGGIRLGSGSVLGSLTSPVLDFDNTTLTVKFTARPYSTDSDVHLTVSYGDETKDLAITQEDSLTVEFNDVVAGGSITFGTTAKRKRVTLSHIEIYSGSFDAIPNRAVSERGNQYKRIITGITDTCYTVTGMIENAICDVKVQATYDDDTTSNWSDTWQVQLHGAGPACRPGDVNADGAVDVDDVNILVNILLEFDTADRYDGRAFILGNGTVAIDDLNALINILLAQ